MLPLLSLFALYKAIRADRMGKNKCVELIV